MRVIHPGQVLTFWIGHAAHDPLALKRQSAMWFGGSDALDAGIEERFGAEVVAARGGDFDAWTATPRGRLALLILLDQFPRNIFRGTPQAFASDARALDLALDGLERGHDQALSPVERLFCYLPLEHAEDPAMQARSMACFERLHEGVDAALAGMVGEWLDYARRHRDVIACFGRFPHRNAILGRSSSPEEAAYLARPGAGF